MTPEQSNTRKGIITLPAKGDLTGKEAHLVKIVNDGGVAKASLPAAALDVANYVVLEGGADGEMASIQPLASDQQVRIVAKTATLVAGDKVVGYASGAAGQLTKYASGDAFVAGIVEEKCGGAGHQLLIRPLCSFIA